MNIHELYHASGGDGASEVPPETAVVRQSVSRLITDLNLVALQQLESEVPDSAGVTPEAPDQEEEEAYRDPFEIQKKEHIAWVVESVQTCHAELAEAETIAKASRRAKAATLARGRFLTRFRNYSNDYTEQPSNVVYSPVALEATLEALRDEEKGAPELYDALVGEVIAYCQKFPLEVMEHAPLLADIINLSTAEGHIGEVGDEILKALFERTGRTGQGVQKTMYLLAGAALELLQTQPLIKALDIYYLRNDIIGDKRFYAQTVIKELYESIFDDDNSTIAEYLQIHAAFEQCAHSLAEITDYPKDEDFLYNAAGGDKGVSRVLVGRGRFPSEAAAAAHMAKVDRITAIEKDILSYDPIKIITVAGSPEITIPQENLPPEIAAETYSLPLYQKRLRTATAKFALQRMSVAAGELIEPNPDAFIHIKYFAISPDAVATVFQFTSAEDYGSWQVSAADERARELITASLLHEGVHPGVKTDAAEPYVQFVYGFYTIPLEEGEERRTVVIVRPSIGTDQLWIKAGQEAHMSMTHLHENALWHIPDEEAAGFRQKCLDRMAADGTRFPGRRPLKFVLPEDMQQSGIRAVSVKQDIDKRYLLATLHHTAGPVELVLDGDFRLVEGKKRELAGTSPAGSTGLMGNLELLVMKLVTEWSCRPVVETSEGTLVRDKRNPSNNPYFLYLGIVNGKKKNFQSKQAAIFARDRTPVTGTTLLFESLRRRLSDPSGQQRNSTWVEDRYDPRTGALEIYLDEAALQSG